MREQRNYDPSLKLRVLPDDWRWKKGERDRWHEPDRGPYFRDGVWIEIKQALDGRSQSGSAFFWLSCRDGERLNAKGVVRTAITI